jgi:hypothetical protein
MAANSIQIVDRQKTIQIMQKECLEEREAEIYRTLLKSSNQFTDINESFAGCGGEYSSAAFCFTDPAPKKCNTPPTHSAKSAEWMGHSVSKLLGRINKRLFHQQ